MMSLWCIRANITYRMPLTSLYGGEAPPDYLPRPVKEFNDPDRLQDACLFKLVDGHNCCEGIETQLL